MAAIKTNLERRRKVREERTKQNVKRVNTGCGSCGKRRKKKKV